MKTVIDKNTGKVSYATVIDIDLLETQIMVDELLVDNFENPYYDFDTKLFYNKEII
jgi:hypothetical protein